MKKYDNVRTYVSPQFSYQHTSTTTTPPSGQGSLPVITSTGHATGGAGAFGAQYTPTPHFSVYGEFGLAVQHNEATFSAGASSTSKGTTWGTIAGIGVIFYP